MSGAPTGGCCSVELLASLAVRIALGAAVFVAFGETASDKQFATFTQAVSPSAPPDRRHAIRRVELLASLAVRIALGAAVFVAFGETASDKQFATFTQAVSPSAPPDRRHAIRSVELLASLAVRIALGAAVFVAFGETASDT